MHGKQHANPFRHGQVNIVDRNFIDTSRNEPDGAFATIMRVLQVWVMSF